MRVLGIETSCDETAVAVVEDGHTVRANLVSSQVAQHAAYGGVIPELAAREHLRALAPLTQLALQQAGVPLAQIDAVAVTQCPGLLPALLVGITYAKGLAAALGKPLLGVHHLVAHIYGALLDHPRIPRDQAAFPLLALIVSGGHTQLVLVSADGTWTQLGQTLDDAAGEAFDKAAKILHLGYPGGPVIDQLAQRGNPAAIAFPRGLVGGKGTAIKPELRFHFSFSGLKTALLYHVRQEPTAEPLRELRDEELLDIVASYQEAVVDVLVRKTMAAAAETRARTLVVCGGVACNSRLRAALSQAATAAGVPLLIAPPKYCTDNAAMIAGLAWHALRHGQRASFDLDALPRSGLGGALPFAPHYQPG
jgi:N6-L-threonylcarbamoyladenine synthase